MSWITYLSENLSHQSIPAQNSALQRYCQLFGIYFANDKVERAMRGGEFYENNRNGIEVVSRNSILESDSSLASSGLSGGRRYVQ